VVRSDRGNSIDRGEVVELTEEQLRHWEETGEWPASLD